jgi:site-specific recombinase XerD
MTRKTFKKIITTPELIEQINPKNKKLMERFLKEKNIRSSDKTITGYASDLNIFMVWNLLENENKFFVDIRKLEYSEFFSYVTEILGWGSARFSRVRSVLSSLSLFIEKFFDTEYPAYRNVILKSIENMPKSAKREKTILKEEQIDGLFKHLEEKGEWQIACWLALAVGSGSRFSELLRFTTDVVDIKNLAFNDIFIETSKPIKSKGRSKSGKMSIKYIIKNIFWGRYQKWLEIRKEIMEKNGKSHNFIFIKNNGDPATEGTARCWVSEIEDFLGIPTYPHAFRHYAVSFLSRMNLPYNLIQDIFDWENVGMVSIYDDLTAKDKKWDELEGLKKSLDSKQDSL